MATIKSFSDLQQSKKLAEILPLESADMMYHSVESEYGSGAFVATSKVITNGFKNDDFYIDDIPCWSLAALFNVLPLIIGDLFSENALRLRMDKRETDFNVWYENLYSEMVEEGLDIIKSNPVDACYELILKLHKMNLL